MKERKKDEEKDRETEGQRDCLQFQSAADGGLQMCVFGAEGEQTEKRRKQRTRTILATYLEYLDQTICFIVWQTTRHLKIYVPYSSCFGLKP